MDGKNTLTFIALLSFAILTWLWGRNDSTMDAVQTHNRSSLLGYYVVDAEIFSSDKDGKPLYWVKAATAREEPDSNHLILNDVTAEYNSSSQISWALKASYGEISTSDTYIDLSGDVHLSTNEEGTGITTIQTVQLRLDSENFVAETSAPVSVLIGNHYLEAIGLRLDLKANQLALESSINGLFYP
ncbi:MAG: LPS export ABC transporter periplasmic protein LptC [Rhodospirillaceae bacterium]|nr:LPS export ABC transporter periplasmic protein LptC [Rhodospirillaceae bacterium]|tara:strand:+ start:2705 stop:3262 length:558 start_codon:yes stop_codon:yes gene_type:complete